MKHPPEQKLRHTDRPLAEGSNARLKKLLAEAELHKAMLKEIAESDW